MCYHTALTKRPEVIEQHLRIPFIDVDVYEPYYYQNGFTHDYMYIIPQNESTHIYPANWGLIPKYQLNDPEKFYSNFKYNTLNARSEDIFKTTTYKNHIHERCLIYCDGFFEPHAHPDGSKQAYFCYIPDATEQDGRKLFCFAGLYSSDGRMSYYTTLLTTEADAFFSEIHNEAKRMPFVLDDEYLKQWISNDLSDKDVKEIIKEGYTNDKFSAYPVTKDFYSRKKSIDKNSPNILKEVRTTLF
ncbi:SOS response-associated peptidase [Autumnicola psychrophila]|uniref:Abasic site processing protein n=1 Tax=Autumnicola psychrophila TaxID=3075592 RepID=A0ABU3DR75_9FLAO|nr:SOS response-associated peptidase family protein [Zunongwangia sp. F225]MDT0685587.1 SOS response-associated peptidase family protein [Zunongwangia sp. F225]